MLDGMPNVIPAALRERARCHAGVVTRKQAVQAGLTPSKIAWLLRRRAWCQLHPGVYATFTGAVPRDARLWAAVLYAGDGAFLSHETAAWINSLTDEPPAIHVTIPITRRVIPPEGVVIHRSSRKPMTWRPPGIPPSTIAERTVIDLIQQAANVDAVIALVTRGFSQRLLQEAYLREEARGCKKLRWRRELDEIISLAAGGVHSPLEYRHDRDVQRAHGLPEPVKQARFQKPDGSWGYRDRCYPQYGGLVIELDGKRYHPEERRGQDTERDNQAAVTGATLRYGWDAVTRRACETARQEAAALGHRGWTGTLRPCSPGCRAVASAPPAVQLAGRGVPATGHPAPPARLGCPGRYASSARSTAAVSARSGSTTCAPASRSSADE